MFSPSHDFYTKFHLITGKSCSKLMTFAEFLTMLRKSFESLEQRNAVRHSRSRGRPEEFSAWLHHLIQATGSPHQALLPIERAVPTNVVILQRRTERCETRAERMWGRSLRRFIPFGARHLCDVRGPTGARNTTIWKHVSTNFVLASTCRFPAHATGRTLKLTRTNG